MIKNKEIGKRIKQRREELNISALEIAEQLGLSKATVHRYESGEIKQIKLPVIESIASLLNVSPSWLIGKTDDRKVDSVQMKSNKTDVYEMLDDMIELLSEADNLTYKREPLSNESRIALISNIEAVKKITEKLK